APMSTHELWTLADRLRSLRLVDLTHPFRPGSPHWSGYQDETRRDALELDACGFWAVYHTLVGAWGTHVDAPAHMFRGGQTLDHVPLRDMILPLAVLDITARVRDDPDAVATLDDVARWESRHGRVPRGAFAALRTGWSSRWPDDAAMQNRDP